MKNRFVVTLLAIALFSNFAFSQTNDYKNLFSEKTLRANIKFLSDDGFEDRAPGSRSGAQPARK